MGPLDRRASFCSCSELWLILRLQVESLALQERDSSRCRQNLPKAWRRPWSCWPSFPREGLSASVLLPRPRWWLQEGNEHYKDEKHMEKTDEEENYAKWKVTKFKPGGAVPTFLPGHCLGIVWSHLWCSVFWHYAAASQDLSSASKPGVRWHYPIRMDL